MALMMGAMIIQGIPPGSAVMDKRPDLFWGMVASMWIGNAMLLVINLPLIGIWVKLLSVPYRLLYPAILLFCVIGVYSTNTEARPARAHRGCSRCSAIFWCGSAASRRRWCSASSSGR